MLIVINSNKNFTKALDCLLNSLKLCNEYEEFKLVICIGGYYNLDNYSIETIKNVTYIKANHNSIDFTGLISILENFKFINSYEDPYIFYMHDTCFVGKNFLKILKMIDLNSVTTYKIKLRSSMNIGIYSLKILENFRDFILNQKNVKMENEIKYKISGIRYEDYIFKNDVNNKILNNISGEHYSRSKPLDYYKTGTMRIIDYYDGIDFYKVKANWGQLKIPNLNN